MTTFTQFVGPIILNIPKNVGFDFRTHLSHCIIEFTKTAKSCNTKFIVGTVRKHADPVVAMIAKLSSKASQSEKQKNTMSD